jgi:peptide/nickel transport system substrate-binding protein
VSKCRSWSLIAAKIVLVTAVATACRVQTDSSDTGLESGQAGTESQEGEAEDEPSTMLVEITRVVVETQVVQVTPTPLEVLEPPKELTICLSEEPATLYPYARAVAGEPARHIWPSLYEPMVTNLSYEYQARGIVKLPSMADGDAQIRTVQVQQGDAVLDVNQDVVTLRPGVTVVNAAGEEETFRDGSLTMSQLWVSFQLQPLVWSDGTPVTADDSVFSFELAADSETPVAKHKIERTSRYRATGERELEWLGVPGYMDRTYFLNVWTPYPRHYWGNHRPGALLGEEVATTRPLSHGPFEVKEWVRGEHLLLQRNQHYYRADEELPRLDTVRFSFVPMKGQLQAQLLSGQCDVASHDSLGMEDIPFLLEAQANGLLTAYLQPGSVFEHIDFGINPVEFYATTRLDWFENVHVRQAMVMCTDRQSMVDDLLFGQSEVVHAYVPAEHPLFPEDATRWPYDVERANALLDEVGLVDRDRDGVRENVRFDVPFVVNLLVAEENELGLAAARAFAANQADCSIRVEVRTVTSERYFADGPSGPLFGRRFDLAAFPWLIGSEPNCSLYLSTRIPGPDNGWSRNYNNNTGFSDEAFDQACGEALALLPGQAGYAEAHREALRLWSEAVPIVPLFSRLKVAAAGQNVTGFGLDSTQDSELWNLYEIDLAARD